MSEEGTVVGTMPVSSEPQQSETTPDQKKDEAVKEVKPEVKWAEIACHENRVINLEKCYAVLLDKVFDSRMLGYSLGAGALIKNADGSFDPNPDTRCPGLSLSILTTLFQTLLLVKKTVKFIDKLSDLPFDAKLVYDNEEVFEKMKDVAKIVVTFKGEEIDEIYAYKIDTDYKYISTLVAFRTMMDDKRVEVTQNQLVQNLFMSISMAQQSKGKTPGGLIVPR